MSTSATRVCLLLLLLSASFLGSADTFAESGEPAAKKNSQVSAAWPQHLGPERNGISKQSGLLAEWPIGGPKELWRVPGGPGMSGMAVDQGVAITLIQTDGKQQVLALDANTGQPKWKTAVSPAYTNGQGDGPRATPTIAGDAVYVFTGEGVLAALTLKTGEVEWSANLVSRLNGKVADYGMAASPLVHGDHVIVTVGAPESLVVAVDRQTGKTRWTGGKNHPAGYSSPTILTTHGVSQLVVFAGNAALGFVPENGKPLWRYPYVTDYDCNIATPIALGNHILLSAGENHGSVVLQTTAPSGDVLAQPKVVWELQGAGSHFRNEWQTSVLLDGKLYGFDNVGSAGPVTHLTCIDAQTGKLHWQEKRFGKGNLIAADGKLFIVTMKGELVVAELNPQEYTELGRKRVLGSTRQAPSLANGRLYLRDDRQIVCLDVSNK